MSPQSSPCVSVGMPIYNCAATLDVAIRSVLNQTFWDWELLLIDDGSVDETVRTAQSYRDPRIRIFSDGTREGLAARLNQAIGLSRGKYFARMDGDDVSFPERFGLQVRYLDQHPEVDLLGGGVLTFGQGGKLLGARKAPTTHEHICQRPWRGFYLAHPAWMGKIEWFRKYLYRAEALRCEDQELLLRTHEYSRFAAVPEIVFGYREEKLSLNKILTGRRHFAAAVFRRAMLRQEYLTAFAAVAEQALKGVADSVAICTGLDYRVLRHRALPVGDDALRLWRQVWGSVQGGALSESCILSGVSVEGHEANIQIEG